jgi:hypothetical protein
MSTNALATVETAAPRIEATELMTLFDHRMNYGRAMFGIVTDKLIHVGNALRHPNRAVATAEAAFALGSGAVGSTVALAQTMPPATPAIANIRFYGPNDNPAFRAAVSHGEKSCHAGAMNIDTSANHLNPTGLRHNKRIGKAWIEKLSDNETQVLHVKMKKMIKLCFEEAHTLNGDNYIIPKKSFKLHKKYNSATYKDPVKLSDQSGHAIRSVVLYFKRKK